MTRGDFYLRDPISRENTQEYLRIRLRILDAKIDGKNTLTSEQLKQCEGERHALSVAHLDLVGEAYVRT